MFYIQPGELVLSVYNLGRAKLLYNRLPINIIMLMMIRYQKKGSPIGQWSKLYIENEH